MKTGYFSAAQLIEAKILNDSVMINTKRLNDLIETYTKSDEYKKSLTGLNYYKGHHDIKDRQKYYTIDGVKVIDNSKSNYKIEHRFLNILIEQKQSYILGNPINITYDKNTEQDKNITKLVYEIFGDKFDDVMSEWVETTSAGAVSYLHCFIDGDGKFDYIVIPPTEVIPIYDTTYNKKLVAVIRFYKVEFIDEDKNKREERYEVEYWTENDVSYYKQLSDGSFYLDDVTGHFTINNNVRGFTQQSGWGKIPFIPLYNNNEMKSDLEDIKSLIDAYDIVKSDWLNDLVDFQELIYVLKGFNGFAFSNRSNPLSIFLTQLKENRAISVDENGGVDTLKAEIPIEARDKFLQILRDEIFYFGKGVDVATDRFGNSPSGISLKFLYTNLDLKANKLILKIKNALTEFMYFVTYYLRLTKGKLDIDYKKFYYTFNKAVIFNDAEIIQNLRNSEGIISEQTILSKHPYVTDVENEMKLKEQERQNEINRTLPLFNNNGNQ